MSEQFDASILTIGKTLSMKTLALTLGLGLMTHVVMPEAFAEYTKETDVKAQMIQLKNQVQENPKDAQLRIALSRAYVKNRDFVSAKKELERAKILGASPEVWMVPLGRLYLMEKSFVPLLETLQIDLITFAKKRPLIQEVYILRGHAFLGLGKLDASKKMYTSALEENHSLVEAWIGLTRVSALEGDFKKARESLAQVTFYGAKDNPRQQSRYLEIKAQLLSLEGKGEQSLKTYQRALELNPSNILAKLGITSTLLSQKKLGEFITHATELYSLLPNHPQAVYYFGLVQYQNKAYDNAEKLLSKFLRVHPNHFGGNILLARTYFAQQKFALAEKAVNKIYKAKPDHPLTASLMGAIKLKIRQPKQAVIALSQVVNEHTTDVRLLSLYGTALVLSGELDKGVLVLSKAAKISPEHSKVRTDLALGLLAKGEIEDAQEVLEEAIELNKDLVQADVLLVFTALNKGDYKQAEEVAKGLIEKRPNNPVPYNLLGLSLKGQKSFELAKKSFSKALELNPDFLNAKTHLASIFIQEKNYPKAKPILEEILKQDINHLQALVMSAMLYEVQGDLDNAQLWLEKAIDRNPKFAEPGIEMVTFYLRHQQQAKALEHAHQLSERFPTQDRVQRLYGQLALMNKDYWAAQQVFSHLSHQSPNQLQYALGLAQAELGLGNFTQAHQAADKVLKIQPNLVSALLLKAKISLTAGQFAQAVQIGQALLKIAPQKTLGYQVMGQAYLASGKPKLAVKVYQKAFDMAPSKTTIEDLYRAMVGAGQKGKGLKMLKDWLKNNPTMISLRRFLATEYLMANRSQEAKIEYEIVLRESNNDIVALNNLASIYLDEQPKQALTLAQKAYQLSPNNPRIADTFGWALIQNGETTQGLAILGKALQQSPDSGEIRLHFAKGLKALGDTQGALREIKQALGQNLSLTQRGQAQKLFQQLSAVNG